MAVEQVDITLINDTSDKWLISKIYKEIIKCNTDKTIQFKKMDKGPEQTLLQRRPTDGQQAYEKILNVTNNQRNAN